MNQLLFQDLGVVSYKTVWDFQEAQLKQKTDLKRAGTLSLITNDLFFVEHPPVYTLGKSGHEENVLLSKEEMAEKGIEYFHINRGGDITFHGPEQIVGYPIIDLEQFKTDLGWYLRSLEEVIIRTIAEYGILGERSKGETGVWIEPHKKGHERKICAMGIRCSRWVTMHGFALNVNADLDYFNYIIPCGIQGKQVASIQQELGHAVPVEDVKQKLLKHFSEVFEVEIIPSDLVSLPQANLESRSS